MADNTDSSELVKSTVYVVGGAIVLGYVRHKLFGGEGSVARIDDKDIDFDKTQYRIIITNTATGEFEKFPSPWNPKNLADQLYSNMSGVNQLAYGETDRSKVWKDLARQGIHRLRWMHNYWLDNIDGDDTLYRWLKGERVLRWSEEHDRREWAKDALRNAGVGF